MMKAFQSSSYLFGGNAPYVEELYESYLNNPGSVPEQWRKYFDTMQMVPAADGNPQTRDVAHAPIVQSFAERAKEGTLQPRVMGGDAATARRQVYVQQLIAAYRFLGSRWADLDPLKRQERPPIPELETAFYDFTEGDHATSTRPPTPSSASRARRCATSSRAARDYCGTIGAEFMYISDPAQKRWIQERLESSRARPKYSAEKKKRILEKLTAAEGLEKYLHTATSARSASRSRAARASSRRWTRSSSTAASRASRSS